MKVRDLCDIWSKGIDNIARIVKTVEKDGDIVGQRVYCESSFDDIPDSFMDAEIEEVMQSISCTNCIDVVINIFIADDTPFVETMKHTFEKF